MFKSLIVPYMYWISFAIQDETGDGYISLCWCVLCKRICHLWKQSCMCKQQIGGNDFKSSRNVQVTGNDSERSKTNVLNILGLCGPHTVCGLFNPSRVPLHHMIPTSSHSAALRVFVCRCLTSAPLRGSGSRRQEDMFTSDPSHSEKPSVEKSSHSSALSESVLAIASAALSAFFSDPVPRKQWNTHRPKHYTQRAPFDLHTDTQTQ